MLHILVSWLCQALSQNVSVGF